MKIVAKTWLSPGRTRATHWNPHILDDLTIGIVIGEDEITGKRKAYIGIGRGRDETCDAQAILAGGGTLPLSILREIVDQMMPEEKKEGDEQGGNDEQNS